jgi:hypothetical protein
MTIHDLMLIAGIEKGEPRFAYRDDEVFTPNQKFYAETGEIFTLEYDDGKNFQKVEVEIP